MAIPKSTFVMGAVTLGLFGFAAYKTLGEKDKVKDRSGYEDEEDSYEGDGEESGEAYEAYQKAREEREEREREEEAAARKKKVQAVHALYGAEAATPGALFAGLAVNAPSDTPTDEFVRRREKFQDDTDSTVTTGSGYSTDRFDRFEIRPGAIGDIDDREALCEELQSGLRTAWGRGVMMTASADVTVWLNPAQKLRATFQHESRCELAFERYVAPAQWITKDATSVVPLSLVGQSVKKLEVVAKTPAEENGEVTWGGPGLGVGSKPTTLTATLERGKVTSIVVTTTLDEATREELDAHLTKLFGAGKESPDDSNARIWTRPKLTVSYSDGDSVSVTLEK